MMQPARDHHRHLVRGALCQSYFDGFHSHSTSSHRHTPNDPHVLSLSPARRRLCLSAALARPHPALLCLCLSTSAESRVPAAIPAQAELFRVNITLTGQHIQPHTRISGGRLRAGRWSKAGS